MRDTLRHCRQLLRAGGVLVATETLRTSPFLQTTFGLTEGWWLWTSDAERLGQGSPLMAWAQWARLFGVNEPPPRP